MRHSIKGFILWIAAFGLLSADGFAQYDDLYYNPDRQQSTVTTTSTTDRSQDLSFGDQGQEYDGEQYDYQSDYDFYYSSRIRRFHRPNRGFDFYDPYYVDMVYYGYRTPGVTIYVGPSYYRPMRPYHHRFGPHYHDPFYNPYAFHRPFRPYGSYGSFGFGYSSWGWGGYGFAGCPVFYSSNTYYVNNYYNNPGFRPGQGTNVQQNVHYGPRSTSGAATARRGGRSADGVEEDKELRAPQSSSSEERIARDAERVAPRGGDTQQSRSAENRTDRSTLDRGSDSELAGTQRRQSEQRESAERSTAATTAAAVPSRRTQEQFRDNRVSRDQAHSDTRSNVPQTRSADRSSSNRVFDNPRTNTRQNTPDTRTQGRDINIDRNEQNRTRSSNPNINRNRNNSGSSPIFNRGNQQRNTTPSPNINRGSNNQRSSGSTITPPRRSSGSNNSSGVSPNRRSSGSSSSGNTRSTRSGRGG